MRRGFSQEKEALDLRVLPAPCTRRHAPFALHPAPYNIQDTPCTLHHAPYTLHPTPYTLHPAPFTPHSTPHTLHPAPLTLDLRALILGTRPERCCVRGTCASSTPPARPQPSLRSTPDLKPSLRSLSYTLIPRPQTMAEVSFLHPRWDKFGFSLDPSPHTLHPTSFIFNPQPHLPTGVRGGRHDRVGRGRLALFHKLFLTINPL